MAGLGYLRNTIRLTLQRCLVNVKPIRTEDDHQEALREIEKLWGAKDGTPVRDAEGVTVIPRLSAR